MKIIVCYKLVCDEQDIVIQPDRTLDTSKAAPKISQFDLNAVEAALQLATDVEGGTVTALSVGGEFLKNSKARKDILSRGPDELCLVIDDGLHGALPYVTAQTLAAAAQKINFDLIICGDGSGDLYAQQVDILTGEVLGIPVINGISKIVSVKEGQLVVERTLENEVEVLEVSLPAVISVTGDINVPRVPTMKAILAASKKPITELTLQEIGYVQGAELAKLTSVLAPTHTARKNMIIEGDSDEQIASFIDQLRKVLN